MQSFATAERELPPRSRRFFTMDSNTDPVCLMCTRQLPTTLFAANVCAVLAAAQSPKCDRHCANRPCSVLGEFEGACGIDSESGWVIWAAKAIQALHALQARWLEMWVCPWLGLKTSNKGRIDYLDRALVGENSLNKFYRAGYFNSHL